MKRLAIYLRPYLGRIGLGFTIKFMGTLLDLMIPWMLSTIIDEVIPTREFQRVLLWGCMMLLCSAAVFAFNVIPNRMASAVARDVTEEVRRDLYQKATLLSCAQMDRITIPSVISRLTTDTYNLHRMIGMMQRLGVRAPILLLGGLIVTMSMEPRLGAVLLAMLPFMGLTIWLILRKGIPMYSVTQKKVDRMIQVVRESVTGIRIIKALSKTDYESGRFDKISKDLSDQEQTAQHHHGHHQSADELVLKQWSGDRHFAWRLHGIFRNHPDRPDHRFSKLFYHHLKCRDLHLQNVRDLFQRLCVCRPDPGDSGIARRASDHSW